LLARVAVSLGLDPYTSGQDIVEALVTARSKPGIKPRVVLQGPCKENVLRGDQVDITKLPARLLHEGDGGRFLNTYGTIVARTPDGKWTNWSIARIMIVDRHRMSGIVAPTQHIGRIHAMWKAEGRDMPCALALGVPPAIPFVSGMPIPDWVDEADYIGVYLGEPVDVIQCESNNLHVPATSEIVVEGRLSQNDTVEEGPMGEYAGYQWKGVSTHKPVYYVDVMTHRNNAILPVVVAGEPVEEDHTAWGIPNAAEVLFQLRNAGVPATMCWPTLEAANHWLVITVPRNWRILAGYDSHSFCRRVGEVLFGSHHGHGMCKAIVFEDDIDPTNTNEVVWGFRNALSPRQWRNPV
jgi:4-hydroxy-3-polyprenylbenzoate decarboxylase